MVGLDDDEQEDENEENLQQHVLKNTNPNFLKISSQKGNDPAF